MDKPTLRLECLKLAYDKGISIEEIVERARKLFGFISSGGTEPQ